MRHTFAPQSLSREEYDQVDAVNWSTLRYALRSGLAYRYRLEQPVAETDAMRLGRAAHTAVFEPDRLTHDYVVWDRGRRAGTDWETFRVAHQGRTILRPEDYEAAIAIRDTVRSHRVASRLLRSGQAECTLLWVDRRTGLRCKARLDWLTSRYVVELKTTRDIDARVFGRHAADMLYHCQLAFIRLGLAAYQRRRQYRIIAVEQEPPHDVAVYRVDEDTLWAGELRVREALDRVAEWRATRRWPGRYPREQLLVLPAWCYPDDEYDTADLPLRPAGV